MARLEIGTDGPSLGTQSIQGIQVANYEHLLSDSRLGTYDRYEMLETYASLRSIFLQLREENPQSPERTLFNRSWAAIIISAGYQHIRNHSSIHTVTLPDEDGEDTMGEDSTDRDGDIGAILHDMLVKEGLLSAQEIDPEATVKPRKRRITRAPKTVAAVVQQTRIQTVNAIPTRDSFSWLRPYEGSGLDFKTSQLPPGDR